MASVHSDSTAAGAPSFSHMMLFWASFFTLIAAGMGFSIRTDIVRAWGQQFGFTQTELGEISGMGLMGFGLTIIFFSFFADVVGYGRLMIVAFLLHAASAVVTLAAPFAYHEFGKEGAYWALYIGAFGFSLANGTCEAVINPLTATLFPMNKTHWLNILHAGWPGGLVLGALCSLGLDQLPGGVTWQVKWGIVLAPILLYGLMMIGRGFPKSEARVSGVTLRQMMSQVGLVGCAVAAVLLGLWFSKDIVPNLPYVAIPDWSGWVIAGILWVAFGLMTNFAFGSLILAFLYVMHAMIGYVELGTDNWIVDITKTVLANSDLALMAFIWTNVLMFTLRFFAGPIVHMISPVGLLFASAVIATAGLWMLGQEFTGTAWPWLAAVTVYGIGKTFYWPTMLGVISERFPKGGALALGFSGGVGMLAAGLLGGPGIGYKQDFFATQKIKPYAAYERYVARDKDDKPQEKSFLEFTGLLPKTTGLDNAKLGVLDNDLAIQKKEQEAQKGGKTLMPDERKLTIELDLELLAKQGSSDKSLEKLKQWWDTQGKPNETADAPKVEEARLYGGKEALLYTAGVPAAMAVGFLLLILVFAATGGYKQVHIGDEH